LQASSVHTLPSLAQAWPPGSDVHVALQQSPFVLFASSHCSPGSTMPLPQRSGSGQLASAIPLSNMSQNTPVSSASFSRRHEWHNALFFVQSAKPGDVHSPGMRSPWRPRARARDRVGQLDHRRPDLALRVGLDRVETVAEVGLGDDRAALQPELLAALEHAQL
jgi:hypothetical protein